MESDLKQLYEKLFAILNEQNKPLLRKIVLTHDECVKKLMDEIDSYKEDADKYEAEVEDQYNQIEALTDQTEHYEEFKTKLKGKINTFRKERKNLLSKKRGIAVSKGRLKAKYEKIIMDMEKIYEIGDRNYFKNIDNLKRRLKTISGEYIDFCNRCEEPEYRCHCE